MVATTEPTIMALKKYPECSMSQFLVRENASGMLPNVQYKTAQAKAHQREKKKTTGSVKRRRNGLDTETEIIVATEALSSSSFTSQRSLCGDSCVEHRGLERHVVDDFSCPEHEPPWVSVSEVESVVVLLVLFVVSSSHTP